MTAQMEELIDVVARQLGTFKAETTEDNRRCNIATFKEIVEHGADTGWPGFTTTSDCVLFFDDNETLIMDIAHEIATDMGCKNVFEMVVQFNRADMLHSVDGFKNLMAWYALEEAARAATDA